MKSTKPGIDPYTGPHLKHPDHMLWELRQYLAKMRGKGAQTIFVRFPDGKCESFGFTSGKKLGDEFAMIGYRPAAFAVQMAEMGLDPMRRGLIYAIIEQRMPEFVPQWYQWGTDR